MLALALISAPVLAASWNPDPWLEDLAQIQQAMRTKYANIDWLTKDRGYDLDRAFARAADRIRSGGSEAEARAAIDRLFVRIADGHAQVRWPARASAELPESKAADSIPKVADACGIMGYDSSRSSPALGAQLPGYRPLDGANVTLPAGTITAGGTTLGIIRIGEFDPHMVPALCEGAIAALKFKPAAPCATDCQDEIFSTSYALLTALLEDRVRALRTAGADVLMIDLADNGGGSEWAEAAARIVSPVPLKSLRMGFVRGEHWSRFWAGLAKDFATEAAKSNGANRARLSAWAAEAERLRSLAADPCATTGSCPLVAQGGYSTGLVSSAKAGELAAVPLAVHAFSIAQYDYQDSVWSGPLIVLVDDETWSAAEEFAAILQDNQAAIIIGSRTGGAGCGHTNGGTPTTLKNSKAVLELPDCVRFRADGSNEVDGVIPDVLTGLRYRDGMSRKAALVAAKLPEAIARAKRLLAKPH